MPYRMAFDLAEKVLEFQRDYGRAFLPGTARAAALEAVWAMNHSDLVSKMANAIDRREMSARTFRDGSGI